MQSAGAYVDQIPASARPPAPAISQAVRSAAPPPAPAGAYVQVATVGSQAEAVRASLDLAARLGPQRPRFIRGEVSHEGGRPHILMFAGPFTSLQQARAFCEAALPEDACRLRTLDAQAPAVGTAAPAPRR